MNDLSSLTDLGRFQPRSSLASANPATRESALRALTHGLEPHKPVRRKVADLLSVVMVLSARTRRMVQPHVTIDVDVFGPNGKRALQLYLPAENRD